MFEEFIKEKDGFWLCRCHRFTDVGLARKLMKIHSENDIPIYLDYMCEKHELRAWEYVDGTLLKYICNSKYITVEDKNIKIFDKNNEDNKEDDNEYVNMLEILGVTLETTPEEFENKLKETEFLDITSDRIYKKLLAIEHRLKRLESVMDSNKEEVEADDSIENKLNKLVGNDFYYVGYNKIRECFPPEARSSFTLYEADHCLSDYDDDDEVKTYLADSDYTEYYHIVVKDGIIIETR